MPTGDEPRATVGQLIHKCTNNSKPKRLTPFPLKKGVAFLFGAGIQLKRQQLQLAAQFRQYRSSIEDQMSFRFSQYAFSLVL